MSTRYAICCVLMIVMLCSSQAYSTDWSDSAYFSWADRGFVTPVVHDQEGEQLCGMMSITAAIESQILWKLNAQDSVVDVSEKWVIICHGDIYYGEYCLAGDDAAIVPATTTGIPIESCFPESTSFDCENYDDYDCSDACSDPYAWASYIDSSFTLTRDDSFLYESSSLPCYSVEKVKQMIVDYGPVTMSGWTQTLALEAWGHPESTDPDCGVWDEFEITKDFASGAHYVLFYGWNDSCRAFDTSCFDPATDSIPCFLAKNSFGPSWGDPGPDGVGQEPGCYKLAQDVPQLRTYATAVSWTPLSKPSLKGPGRYSAYTLDSTSAPPDTVVKFLWSPGSAVADEYRLNVVELPGSPSGSKQLVHSSIVQDTSFLFDQARPGDDYL